jgi:hypothetical protein
LRNEGLLYLNKQRFPIIQPLITGTIDAFFLYIFKSHSTSNGAKCVTCHPVPIRFFPQVPCALIPSHVSGGVIIFSISGLVKEV